MISIGGDPTIYHYVLWLLAGMLLANGVPHFVQGICGNKFQTPFASPPRKGESSAIVNVLWGFFNLAAGGLLIHYYFPKQFPQTIEPYLVTGAGTLAIALFCAWHFGRVRKGKATKRERRA